MPKKWLKRHKERKHVDKSDKKFVCDQLDKFGNNCKYASHRKDQLSDHLKRRHTGKFGKFNNNTVVKLMNIFQCWFFIDGSAMMMSTKDGKFRAGYLYCRSLCAI